MIPNSSTQQEQFVLAEVITLIDGAADEIEREAARAGEHGSPDSLSPRALSAALDAIKDTFDMDKDEASNLLLLGMERIRLRQGYPMRHSEAEFRALVNGAFSEYF